MVFTTKLFTNTFSTMIGSLIMFKHFGPGSSRELYNSPLQATLSTIAILVAQEFCKQNISQERHVLEVQESYPNISGDDSKELKSNFEL